MLQIVSKVYLHSDENSKNVDLKQLVLSKVHWNRSHIRG